MIKEKIIFLSLLTVFIVMVIFAFGLQGKKREAGDMLLQDIESAMKKIVSEKKSFRDIWDFEKISSQDRLDRYDTLLKRSLFFRVISEIKPKKVEVLPIKEEPKKPIFKYKGKVTMAQQVKVIIEDEGTGKSFFVQEGDLIGDFLVAHIDEKQVTLKRQDGAEEIILSVVKKEEAK